MIIIGALLILFGVFLPIGAKVLEVVWSLWLILKASKVLLKAAVVIVGVAFVLSVV